MAGGELVIRAVENYLAARHAAGFELKSQSYLVRSFARFAAAQVRNTSARQRQSIGPVELYRWHNETRD